MEALKNLLRHNLQPTPEELDHLLTYFQEKSLRKNRYLLRPGQVCQSYYFIERGAFRLFYQRGEKDITGWLAFENDFFTDLSSFKHQTPSRFYIQAMEDSQVLTISQAHTQTLSRAYPAWQGFLRNVWEDAFLNMLEGMLSFQTDSAEQRYERLLRERRFLQRVPLKYLSSFLGITPTSLSRLRKKFSNEAAGTDSTVG